jgi:hypothetical protein
MFPKDIFDKKTYEPDMFANTFPVLKLDDLLPKQDTPIKMSFLISFTENRKTQLARSLECLARQTFKEFEVLICDDGSRPQKMEEVYDKFIPFLHMKVVRLEREGFSSCPSRGIKELVPLAQGEILATMQPEMMLTHDCAEWLYNGHFNPIPDNAWTYYVNMDRRPDIVDREKPKDENAPRFLCTKVGFFDRRNQDSLDGTDWHSDTHNVEKMPQFWIHSDGLSGMNNVRALEYNHFPWWFVCSMRADDTVWHDLPHTVGHASIDFFFLNYRAIKGYIDICPKPFMAYHQHHSHYSTSISPIGEQQSVSAESLRKSLNL